MLVLFCISYNFVQMTSNIIHHSEIFVLWDLFILISMDLLTAYNVLSSVHIYDSFLFSLMVIWVTSEFSLNRLCWGRCGTHRLASLHPGTSCAPRDLLMTETVQTGFTRVVPMPEQNWPVTFMVLETIFKDHFIEA